jgi:hypothetical protein
LDNSNLGHIGGIWRVGKRSFHSDLRG